MSTPSWADLEALFHQALARAPAERGAFLAERCADRPDLYAEVEALLRAHDCAASALEVLQVTPQTRLKAGMRLGSYEVLSELGAGGMGEVYRARDTTLGRDVAIKILPSAFTADPERLARFEREARVLATLNHPNIGAIYGVDESDGVKALVMELVEGDDLSQRIARGAIPLDEALPIAKQIAEALEAAHERGIIHRDLKPANIKVRSDGAVKVLDFGLAKAMEPPASSPNVTQSPTITTPAMTQAGMILGTAAYMSPEQARGRTVDKRADIWTFGAVLFEMLTGKRAFPGDDLTDTLVAVVKLDPKWDAVGADVPGRVRQVLRVCLQKDPRQRAQAIGDIRLALEGAFETAVPPAATLAPSRRWRPAVAIGAAIAAAFAVGVFVARPPRAQLASATTFLAKTFDKQPITNARFMPDDQTIVYSAAPKGFTPDLFVIRPDSEAPEPLGVSKAHLLAVSSKGELAVITDAQNITHRLFSGTLARMTLGSAPRPVLEHVREADWSPDGTALAIVHDLGNGRDRLEYPVGTALHEASGYVSDPRVSPDGSHVAFFEHQLRFDDRGWVKVVDRTGHVTTLTGEYWGMEGLAWTPDGSTILFSGNDAAGTDYRVMAVPASGRAAAETALGVPGRFIVYDTARDGRWLASRDDFRRGVRARVPGQLDRDLSWLGMSEFADLSADGEWLLLIDFSVSGGKNYGVVLRRTDGSAAVRLGEGAAQKLSPDGKWALAIISTPPALVIYPMGPGEPRRFKPGAVERYQSAEWFSDGARVLACGAEASRAPRCYVQDVSGSPATPVTPEGVVGTLTPDSRTLLLTMPDGTFQLSAIAGGPPQRVDGLRPEDHVVGWSRDGRSVFVGGRAWADPPATVERVELTTGRRTVAGQMMAEAAELGRVDSIFLGRWNDEGRSVGYSYRSTQSTLFVVSGATAPR